MKFFKTASTPVTEERRILFRPSEANRGEQSDLIISLHELTDSNARPQTRNLILQRFQAISLAILSGLAFNFCALSVHLLDRINPAETLLFRSAEQSLLIGLALFWIYCTRWRRNQEQLESLPMSLIIYQGTVMAVSLQLLFIAFQHLPLGDASALVFSAPAHVSVLAWIMLGEKPNFSRVVAILGIIVGGVLVCQGTRRVHTSTNNGDQHLHWVSLSAAIVGTFGYSLHFVLIRQLRDVHYSLTTFSLSVQTFIISAIVLFTFDTFKIPSNDLEWGLLSTVGVVGSAGHILLAKALSMEEVAVVASTRSLDIAVAYIAQIIICQEAVTTMGITGAALISACVILMALEPFILPRLYKLLEKLKALILRNQ